MKEFTCCFTGHRDIPAYEKHAIKNKLLDRIARLIFLGVNYYGCGGALGFDTLAAFAVLRCRKEFPQIRLILVLPCKNQTFGWTEENIKKYEYIKKCADKIVYTSEYYCSGCMLKRNRHLVEYSNYCICYLNELKGGTAYTVNYAREKGLKIIYI